MSASEISLMEELAQLAAFGILIGGDENELDLVGGALNGTSFSEIFSHSS